MMPHYKYTAKVRQQLSCQIMSITFT